MRGKTIAEHMADIMNEEGQEIVWYGDLDILHECADRAGSKDRVRVNSRRNTHPMTLMQKVLAGLDRSDLFEKSYIKHIGRPARAYRLKEDIGGADE